MGKGLFPLTAIDGMQVHFLDRLWIDAACVDAVTVRMRAWHIEGLGAAGTAEQVLCGARIKRVGAERIRALQQLETLGRHDQMQKTEQAADRAIALFDIEYRGGQDFEAHLAAMAAA